MDVKTSIQQMSTKNILQWGLINMQRPSKCSNKWLKERQYNDSRGSSCWSWGGTSTFSAGQSSRWRCTSPSTVDLLHLLCPFQLLRICFVLLHLLQIVPMTPFLLSHIVCLLPILIIFKQYFMEILLQGKYIIIVCVAIWHWNSNIFPAAGFWPQRVTCLSWGGRWGEEGILFLIWKVLKTRVTESVKMLLKFAQNIPFYCLVYTTNCYFQNLMP